MSKQNEETTFANPEVEKAVEHFHELEREANRAEKRGDNGRALQLRFAARECLKKAERLAGI